MTRFMVLPRFRAPNGSDVGRALAASTQVQGGDSFAVITFHQRMARVREAVSRLDDLLRYAEAGGTEDSLTFEVAQLPHRENDRWVGFAATPDQPLAAGRLSLILHISAAVGFAKTATGLMIGEWLEVVPNASETTGVVFQSNQPDSCPPRAILLAVPPNPSAQNFWTAPVLIQVLPETMDLVRVRAVTLDLLEELGQYLPALYFSVNAQGDTIRTDFLTQADYSCAKEKSYLVDCSAGLLMNGVQNAQAVQAFSYVNPLRVETVTAGGGYRLLSR